MILNADEGIKINREVQPLNVVRYEGSDISLHCNSDTPVVWEKEGEEYDKLKHFQQGNNLIMKDVTTLDSGTYSCVRLLWKNKYRHYVDVFIGGQCINVNFCFDLLS